MHIGLPLRIGAAAVLLAGLWSAGAAADTESTTPTVVELFTSQSCYSCPPAERLLGELAGRDDVIALEHHVDYWDKLIYGSAGRWKDVFSSPEATQRQRAYNRAIRGTGSVYTPQMILDGRRDVVGNREGAVVSALAEAGRAQRRPLDVSVMRGGDGALRIRVAGDRGEGADVWILRFLEAHTTRVAAGENKGKTLTNHHVVRDIRRVGTWGGDARDFVLSDYELDPGFGCAVLVQEGDAGPILGAARCPAPVS